MSNPTPLPKEEKRPLLEIGDIRASLCAGYIIVRDVPTNAGVGLSREEAVALATWILEYFE